jgi:tyrosyl-tRNA synthetase
MTHAPGLLSELGWRGLLQAQTDGLEARLERGPISAYVGFDPTGPSLHVGHLVQVFLLTHLQRAGGRPVALIGGGTGMIGDPSGKSAERNLIDDATLDENKARFREQLGQFIDFADGSAGGVMLDNREWLGRYTLLEFLRDIGKHFTVPYMLAKESVQVRLASGLSFTEFSYMTLQAADFSTCTASMASDADGRCRPVGSITGLGHPARRGGRGGRGCARVRAVQPAPDL